MDLQDFKYSIEWSHIFFTQFPQVATSCVPKQYQSQETDIGKMYVYHSVPFYYGSPSK